LPPSVTFTVPTIDLPSTLADACSTFVMRLPAAAEAGAPLLAEPPFAPQPATVTPRAAKRISGAFTACTLAADAEIKGS